MLRCRSTNQGSKASSDAGPLGGNSESAGKAAVRLWAEHQVASCSVTGPYLVGMVQGTVLVQIKSTPCRVSVWHTARRPKTIRTFRITENSGAQLNCAPPNSTPQDSHGHPPESTSNSAPILRG